MSNRKLILGVVIGISLFTLAGIVIRTDDVSPVTVDELLDCTSKAAARHFMSREGCEKHRVQFIVRKLDEDSKRK